MSWLKGSDEISNSQDVIDSRDVIARIEQLEEWEQEAIDEAAAVAEKVSTATDDDIPDLESGLWGGDDGKKYGETADWDEDTLQELQALKSLADEASGSPDWVHGQTLIRDSYFEDYARQFADDIGAINRESRWPNNHIDWEAAASDLQNDYTSVDFDGVTYWIRG